MRALADAGDSYSAHDIGTVAQLQAAVGTEIDVGPWVEVTQELVDAFAELSGDHQWIHVDRERAGASRFGGTIAHGNLLFSIIPRLRTYRITMPVAQALNYGLDRLRFPAPCRVGSKVRLRTTILKAESIPPDQLQVVLRHTLEVQGGERPVMVAEPITRFYLAEGRS